MGPQSGHSWFRLQRSQQSWGVCQDPVLSAGRRALSRASSRTRAPSISLEARGGQVRGAGGGGGEGLRTLYFPPGRTSPRGAGRGGPGAAGEGTPRPGLGDAHAKLAASPVTCAQDKRPDRDSGLRICGEAAAWGWRQERAIFPKGWRGRHLAAGARDTSLCNANLPGRAPPARPPPPRALAARSCFN